MGILVIDDHAETARLLARLFRLSGRAAVSASSLREAWAAVSEGGIDLLVSDVELPDGSGLDFMRELKRSHAVHGIALTGHIDEGIERKCREAGFDRFFTKPAVFEALMAAVEELSAGKTG
jgi:CheY-like chemotaxis protein